MDSGILIFLVLSVSFTVYMCVDKIADTIKIKARLENGLDENGKMREEKIEKITRKRGDAE